MPKQDFIERAGEALGGGVLKAGAPYLAQARCPVWFQDFALLEAEAVSEYSYEKQPIPGLLQTEDYARALLMAHCPPLDGETLERRLQVRPERQPLLDRATVVFGFVVRGSRTTTASWRPHRAERAIATAPGARPEAQRVYLDHADGERSTHGTPQPDGSPGDR